MTTLRRHEAIVDIRQAAEWGVRDVKGSYPRLKALLPTDDQVRGDIFRCIVHLYNMRTATLGYSQVRSVYEGHAEANTSLFGLE